MDIKRFDEWRLRYDTMSYGEHQRFSQRVVKEYPRQQGHWDPNWVMVFFRWIAGRIGVDGFTRVLEIGGFDGSLAKHVMTGNGQIVWWTNVELVTVKSVCAEKRYQVVVPKTWIWDSGLEREWKYSAVVLSHIIEHLRFRDVGKLVDMVAKKCNWIYVDAPIATGMDGEDWKGYHGTHILEVGWGRIDTLLELYGFRAVIDGPSIHGYVKFYERVQ
jgi:hypothetical protein